VRNLGGGRLTQASTVDPEVGVDRLAKPGDSVKPGDVLARVHASDSETLAAAVPMVRAAFTVAD